VSTEKEVLELLIRQAYSPDVDVRTAAAKQISELPDETVLQFLANHPVRSTATNRRLASRMTHALPYALFTLAIAWALRRDPSAGPLMKGVVAILGVGIVTMLLTVMGCLARSLRWYGPLGGGNESTAGSPSFSMVSLIADRSDARFLPYLLSDIAERFTLFERDRDPTDMIRPGDACTPKNMGCNSIYSTFGLREANQQRRRYRRLVKGLLSQIGPEQAIELSAEQRHALLLPLQRPEDDVELAVGILNRLEQWGDAQTVPALKRLIREGHWYVGSDQVEAAVRQCLEEIEARLKQQKQNSALLRPAQSSDAQTPQSLLRPVGDRPEAAPEQLLRPHIVAPPDRRE
jgi:hypothetical protein